MHDSSSGIFGCVGVTGPWGRMTSPVSLYSGTLPQRKQAARNLLVQSMAEVALGCLTLKQVQNELREVTEWYSLGVQLGIETTILKQIRGKHSDDPALCKLEVFEFWLANASDTSWEALLSAVDALGTHARLVRKLQSYDIQSEANGTTLTAKPESETMTNSDDHGHCHGNGTSNTENLYTKLQDEPPVGGCMPTGDDYDESDLKVETDKIMLNFGALVTRVRIALKQIGITVDELASHLETVKALEPVYALSKTPLLLDCIEEVRAQKSVGDAFRCFSDYYSWFNYLLIENIINAFCRHITDIQEGLAEFIGQFQEYCKNRLSKCPKNGFGLGRKKDASTLVVKVDYKWEVARVNQIAYIKDAVARVLSIKKQALYLRTIKNGCIELTFLVPKFVGDAVSSINPDEIANSLCSIGVLELFCEDFIFYQTGDDEHNSGAESLMSEDELMKNMPCQGFDTEHMYTATNTPIPNRSDDSSVAESEDSELGSNLDGSTFEMLDSTSQRKAAGESEKYESCPVHKKNRISVYCETCRKGICSNCALFEKEHKGHSFKPLDVIYKKPKEAFLAEMCKLKEVIRELVGDLHLMENRLEGVRASRQKVNEEIRHALEMMYTRLDSQAQVKLQQLGECRHQLKSKVIEIGKTYHELEANMSKAELLDNLQRLHSNLEKLPDKSKVVEIDKAYHEYELEAKMSTLLLVDDKGKLRAELLDNLQRLHSYRTDLKELPDVGEFINEVVPSYDSSIFKIHPFRELQYKGEVIYSRPLHVYGLTWRLKVYPDGHKEGSGTYLSVFVELTDGFDRVSNYQYCIEMLHGSGRHPERSYKREYGSDFADGESWGYRKFYKLSKLIEDGFLYDNTLVLRFSIRAPTYYQKCRDLTSYIQLLEDDESALQQKLQAAHQQLKSEQSRPVPSSRPHESPSHGSQSQVDLQSGECSSSPQELPRSNRISAAAFSKQNSDPAVAQYSPPSLPRSKTLPPQGLSYSHQELRQLQDKLLYDPGEEDNSDLINVGALHLHEGLLSQPHLDFDHFEQETSSPTLPRQEPVPGLSQPSPPRAKHGKLRMSLTDLSSFTNSTSNLSHSHSQPSPPRAKHGKLRMSLTDLSSLKHPMVAALRNMKEEIEKRQRGELRRPGGYQHLHSRRSYHGISRNSADLAVSSQLGRFFPPSLPRSNSLPLLFNIL